ncbi:ABC transporter permease [Saccharothrix sp. 6-C]|uniref:ABC-2 type transport system permease protein n=1 Tax=Saccharothrix texasensis TaxID=103734 RepID=A0A3N1H3A1_9PSEU|nr:MULTISPECIES: ABC transporter permease [Saccharothrix]QQQ78366.1 ABC transporter permease [Saccharothrix sp. 6-C]ROP36978.1 ABC-2 type transport system permease protein [Saccharothrix texasensis]
MNARVVAVRAGVRRGRIEFGQTMGNAGELMGWLWLPVVALVVMYAFGDGSTPGVDFPVGAQAVPGILAMSTVFSGLMGLAMTLTMDREDGTLLRAKATPNGVLAYVIGKVLAKAAMTVAVLVLVLVPAMFLFDGLEPGRASTWATLAWVLVLGLLAVLPIGAIVGALFGDTQSLGFVTLLVMALVVVSGVFYPITALPEWVQWVGQAFPLYWLGLGLRSALLPDAVAAAEIGGSWRHLETVIALGAWAVVGLALASVALRRMARRESGASVAARRDKVAQRLG